MIHSTIQPILPYTLQVFHPIKNNWIHSNYDIQIYKIIRNFLRIYIEYFLFECTDDDENLEHGFRAIYIPKRQ